MLRKLKEFEYFEPSTISDVISLLDQYGEAAKIIAGGTDLLVAMKERRANPACLINIKGIPGLNHIKYNKKEGLRIGALTTIREIETSSLIREKFPSLFQAAKVLGSVQIRNRATIAGNLSNASPSAEFAPPLLVLDAALKLECSRGERVLPLEQFFLGPGSTALDKEVLTEIIVPSPSVSPRDVYMSISRREAVDLALVSVAATAAVNEGKRAWKDVKIALGAVAPTPMRAHKAEEALGGKKIEPGLIAEAARIASEEARPISDVRASAWYRKEMVKVLVQSALEHISQK